MSQCEFIDDEFTYCDSMLQALSNKVIEPHRTYKQHLVIDKSWLPLNYCPWCGQQI